MNIELPPRIWLPRSGQTTTAPTANYSVGDDGYFQAGSARATRFIDNGNGTISGRATGLMWIKQPELIIPGATGVHASNQIQAARGSWANGTAYALADLAKDTADSTYWVCVSAHTSAGSGTFAEDRGGAAAGKWRQTVWTASAANLTTPAAMTWANAVGYCLGSKWDAVNPLGAVGLSYAGYTDWRLPNWIEMVSLSNVEGTVAPLTYGAFFPNTKVANYYTSSTYKGSPTYAHVVAYVNPYLSITVITKTTAAYVRPVRGGRLNANG